jgi:hypothetical protein
VIDRPGARIVLLGASNLTLSFPWARAAAVDAAGGEPAEVLVAAGLGRAYGLPSRILMRQRTAILECGLWRDLAEADARRPTPIYALLTDLGNDLAYGASATDLAAAVNECLARLGALGATCAASTFPVASVECLSPFRFGLLRSVLFPGHAITRPELLAEGREFNRLLREMCARAGCALTEISSDCFGLDHIHLTWRWRRRLWPQLVGAWRSSPVVDGSQKIWVGQPSVESSTAWY